MKIRLISYIPIEYEWRYNSQEKRYLYSCNVIKENGITKVVEDGGIYEFKTLSQLQEYISNRDDYDDVDLRTNILKK